MPGLTDILHTARDALTAQSFGLGVAGQNVANVNTPGYVRRQADIQSQPLGSQSFGSVVAKGIIRVADQYIEQRHYSAVSLSASASESDSLLGQVESLFDVQGGANAGSALSELYGAFSELTTDPSNRALRTQVLSKAQAFSTQIESTAQSIASLRTNLTQQASSTADSVNQLAASISDVTKKIHSADAAGYDAADLKDQRDSMLKDLSKLVDVRTFTNEQGQLVVQASGTTLIEGDNYRTLQVSLDADGKFQILARNPSGAVSDVSRYLTGGKLAAIRDVHDVHTTELLDQLDTFAFDVATSINTQHQAGFDLSGTAGVALFDVPATAAGASRNLKVNAALLGHPELLAASSTATGVPGGNGNALLLSQLTDKRIVNGGTQSGAEAFASTLADVGNRKRTAEFDAEVKKSMEDQTFAMRESVSGVNLDEEMLNLTKYQRAYEAASRVLTTADQLLSELIASIGR